MLKEFPKACTGLRTADEQQALENSTKQEGQKEKMQGSFHSPTIVSLHRCRQTHIVERWDDRTLHR